MSDPAALVSAGAPAPIGPYSQAIAWERLVFCSGQVALDPEGGELVGGGDVRRETERVLANLAAVLAEAGCAPHDILKTTIYLTDLGDFGVVNELYGEWLGGGERPAPARVTVAVSALPKGGCVEIDALALRPV